MAIIGQLVINYIIDLRNYMFESLVELKKQKSIIILMKVLKLSIRSFVPFWRLNH